ncbi:MAG: hypothetical protein ACF8XB_21425, partial [Planctomycetota bacterium JB042]
SVLPLVLLLGAAAPADAAGPAKKAVKGLKKECSTTLKVMKKQVSSIEKVLDANLDTVDLKLKSGGGSKYDVQTVFDALVSYQQNLGAEMNEACDAFRLAYVAAESTLDDAGLGDGDHPKEVYVGGGGVADAFLADVLNVVDKSLAAAEKRVRKTAAQFEKRIDVGVLVNLDRPQNLRLWPGPSGSTYTPLQHTIAVALSNAPLDQEDEGTVRLWGNCYSSDSLTIQSNNSHGANLSATVVTNGNSWQYQSNSVDSGHHVLKLKFTSESGGGAYSAIGVR